MMGIIPMPLAYSSKTPSSVSKVQPSLNKKIIADKKKGTLVCIHCNCATGAVVEGENMKQVY
jgi:hypothetical protein